MRGLVLLAAAAALPLPLFAADSYQLDPSRAGDGWIRRLPDGRAADADSRADARAGALARRAGTSCCLAGTCECGGSYKHDPEINARVAAAIRNDARFRNASIWITTTRKFVTLQGCVRTPAQKRALERLVRRQPDVALVWNETTVGPVRHTLRSRPK